LYTSLDQDIVTNLHATAFTPNSIIVGDLNSKNTRWGSPRTDKRGASIEKLIDENNFTVLNNGQPTYTHHNGTRSRLGLSLACHTLATNSNWEILSDTLGSDQSPTITSTNIHFIDDIDISQKCLLTKG